MPHSDVDFDGRLLVINSSESKESEFIRIERICYMRQHLPDSFQFFVRDGKGKDIIFIIHVYNSCSTIRSFLASF